MSEYSDKELLDLFSDKEKRNYAFNLIVRKYQEKLYWHIRKIVVKHDDTDDILQNTFIKVWKGLDGFRKDSKLYTWLYRIATNESLTFLKQQKTKYLLPIVDYENHLSETLECDEYFNGDEIQCKLQKAILELPEKQRIVFNLKYFEEMKYDDMSEILETSVGALKASYHHAVKKIENYFKED
ncbi:MAG: RNA polymerase sigma factor [Bacteroidales bacterium]|jgi:RNA polymerase sigma-70 factor (ECF subfamily)|nr:RNA polymerase sigma factor [Bacteroidales bacterium]